MRHPSYRLRRRVLPRTRVNTSTSRLSETPATNSPYYDPMKVGANTEAPANDPPSTGHVKWGLIFALAALDLVTASCSPAKKCSRLFVSPSGKTNRPIVSADKSGSRSWATRCPTAPEPVLSPVANPLVHCSSSEETSPAITTAVLSTLYRTLN